MRASAISTFLFLAAAAVSSRAEPPRSVYIVSLDDAPVATFRGAAKAKSPDGRPLEATAPEAIGAKHLSVDTPASRAYLDYLDARHGDVLAGAKSRLGRELAPKFRYRVAANGFAVELTAEEAATLATVPGVLAVKPERVGRLLTDAGPAFIGADQLWNGNVPGLGADKGEGAVVGVIDSGLNFAHPSFAATGADGYAPTNPRGRVYGLCQTNASRCNGKLIGIYDYTSDGTRDGSDGTGHGSHVASTAAGNVVASSINGHTTTVALTISGVAPHASLIVYKACTSKDQCPESMTLAAIDQATTDRVDVVNYSIGGLADDPWTAVRGGRADSTSAMLSLRAAGVVPVVAAGNDGPDAGTVASPGNAPWVISAAAANHNRRFATTLADLGGPGIATTTFVGEAISGALPTARVVDAADYGSALCGVGDPADVATPGSDNPFPPGTFHGEIVVCLRGVYARVNKGYNVKAAGAGGMVLANSISEGESRIADDHYLPAVHLGYADGQRLYALLAQVKQGGGNATASITATERRFDARGDVLAGFSSRGPVQPYGGWLKPNVTAPGVNIIAAAQTGTGLATMSGTSMASPHTAGAAALLRSAHPSWSVAQIESALLTHNTADVLKEDAVTPATPNDGGAGRVDVPGAARSALTFNVTSADFRNADPTGSAVLDANPPDLPNPITRGPSALNMPYLVAARCLGRCTLSRTVTDNGAGSAWRAELHLPAAALASVTPSSFELSPNASQKFSVSFDVRDLSLAGSRVDGDLTLVNTAGGAPDVRIPISVYADPGALPAEIDLDASADGGFQDVPLSGLTELSNPRLIGGGLVPIRVDTRTIPVDPNIAGLFDTLPRTGAFYDLVSIPNELDTGGAPAPAALDLMIYAQASSTTARDVDLYVGIDTNGDGKPNADEIICQGNSSAVLESCILHRTATNLAAQPSVWFLVQNAVGGQGGGDAVKLRYAVTARDSGRLDTTKSYARYGLLRATGPGVSASAASFPVRLAWSTPGMQPGETWLGTFAMSATAGGAAFGDVPVLLNVSAGATRQPVLMSGLGDTIATRLAANGAHDRIAIDVPPGASALTVDMSGSGEADLYLVKATNEPAGPAIGVSPPRTQSVGSSIHSGAAETITLAGANLTPGRYYILPQNTSGFVADVALRAQLAFGGAAPATPDSAWFDPQRSGHGMFLNFGGDQWIAFWYAYLQDGSPAWYLAQAAAPASTEAVWSAPLTRFTWNGSANAGTIVGRLTLLRTGDGQLNFNWLLDGTYGSETMVPLTAPGTNCPSVAGAPTDFSGAWYAPAHSGYGYSVVANASTETEVAYLYDGAGNPRWLYGQNAPFGGGNFDLTQFRGFCPLCAYSAIQGTVVGQLARTFATPRTGTASVSASFVAPASGSWSVNDATAKLTRDIACH